MSLQPFIERDNEVNSRIARLRGMSKVYPEIVFDIDGAEINATTLIRIFRDGKYYLVHAIESYHSPKSTDDVFGLTKKIIYSAYHILMCYSIEGIGADYCELDPDQTPEDERIRKTLA